MRALRISGPELSEQQATILDLYVQGLTPTAIAGLVGGDAESVQAETAKIHRRVFELLEAHGAVYGPIDPIDTDTEPSDDIDWEPKVQFILEDYGNIKVTVDRPRGWARNA